MQGNASPKRAEIARQCDELVKQFRADLDAREEALAQNFRRQIASRLEGLQKERVRTHQKLAEVPFFRFSRKRSLREEIHRLDKCIGEYSGPAALQQARMEYIRRVEKAAQQYRAKLDGYLAHRFPYEAMRLQAQADFDSWYQGSHSQVKDLIYAALQKSPNLTREELSNAHPLIAERSERRIEFLLGEMEKKGEISGKVQGAALRYSIAGPQEPKRPKYPDLDFGYEDPELAAQPIPQPPAVEEIL